MKKILFFIIIIFLVWHSSAETQTKIANDPLRINVGARPLGMGKAFSAISMDLNSMFLNPAGVATIPGPQLTSMSGKFIGIVDYTQFGAAYPTPYGSFGIGYGRSGLSFTAPAATTEAVDGIRIIESTTEGISASYGNTVWLITYGVTLHPLLSVGTALKFYSHWLRGPDIPDGTASGYNMDVGILSRPTPAVSLALSQSNILANKLRWTKETEETFPSTTKIGTSLLLLGKEGFFEVGENKLTLAADFDINRLAPQEPSFYHVGLEWQPLPILNLRLGIDQDVVGKGGSLFEVANNATYGVGINWRNFRFDYAYHTYYGLRENDTHYFSLAYGTWQIPPPKSFVEVIEPADKSILYTEKATVRGRILEDVKHIFFGGQEVEIAPDNTFTFSEPLKLGKNIITFNAYDRRKNLLRKVELRLLRLATFPDVDPTYFARLPIEYLATLGIMPGYPDGTFRPFQNLTRAELTFFLVKLRPIFGINNLSLNNSLPSFSDVSADHWAAPYIAKAEKAGIIKGYPDGTFRPDNLVNRVEGILMLRRFAKVPETRIITEPFPDLPGRHWAALEVTTAKEAGFLEYLSGEFLQPKKKLTRGEIAEMLSHTKPAKELISRLLDFAY